jgi:hypothetical protein
MQNRYSSLATIFLATALSLAGFPPDSFTQGHVQSEKVILDTDIGGDIDDSFALCLALEIPELEILGITTVWGFGISSNRHPECE